MSALTFAKKDSVARASAPQAASSVMQGRLRIGEPDDAYEQEADRVADEAVAGGAITRHWTLTGLGAAPSVRRKCACGGSGGSDGECEDCKRKTAEQTLRRKAAGPTELGVAPPIVREALNSPAQPLDKVTRSYFERGFGQDLGSVRVHCGPTDAKAAGAVNARAYTVGEHIVLNTGQYAPHSSAGRRLLAHELTHVLQQRAGTATFAPPGPPQEVEADRASEAFSQGARSFSVQRHSGIGVARDPQGSGGTLGPTITPEIKSALVQKLFDARRAAPPAGIRQNAVRTFAVAAIVSPDGKVTYESAYYDTGTEHAEPQLLRRVAAKVKPGDTVAIAIDQVPCGPNKANCAGTLGEFRADPQHGSMRVYTVRALRRDAPAGTTPETATPDQLVGPKTAITREPQEKFLVESVEFRRVRLPIYSGPDTPESTGSPGAGAQGGDVAEGQSTGPKTTGVGAGEEDVEARPARRIGVGSEPGGAEPGFTRTLGFAALNFAAGVGTSLLQGWMREKIAEDLAKLPQPKRDKRGVWAFLNDPGTRSAVRLLDVLSKDIKPYTADLQPQHTKILVSAQLELAAIALLPEKTTADVEKRFARLDALKEEMAAYEEQLSTVQDNLESVLAMEPQAKQTKSACDDLIAKLPTMFAVQAGASSALGFVPVPDPEDYSSMDSNLRYLSVSIGMVFADAHSAKGVVDKAVQETTTFRTTVAKIWWEEFAAQVNARAKNRPPDSTAKTQPLPTQRRAPAAQPQGPQLLPGPGFSQQKQEQPQGPTADPFGLLSPAHPQPLSGISMENAKLAADEFERARKALFRRYEQLASEHFPTEKVKPYQDKVNAYVARLDWMIGEFLKKGSAEWPGVKEMRHLRDAADNEDRSKLMR